MTNLPNRTVVREIPAPIPDWPERPAQTVSRVPWLSALTFATGLVTYFWVLIYTYSVTGIAVAIFLIVLSMIFYVAWALNRLEELPRTVLSADAGAPSDSEPRPLPTPESHHLVTR